MNVSRNKLIRIIEYIIAFLFIIDCHSLYGIVYNFGNTINNLLVGLMILYIIFILPNSQQYIMVETIEISGIISVYLGIYGVLTHQTVNFYRLLIIVVLMIWIIKLGPTKNGLPNLLVAYGKILSIVAAISLFFWLFGSFLRIIKPSGVVYSSWGARSGNYNALPTYFNLYFESQDNDLNLSIFQGVAKNTAIFSEAPMAALNFSIGLLTQLFNKKSKWDKCRKIVLILGILSTFSITGYIFLLLLAMIRIGIQNKAKMSNNFRYFIVILSLVCVIAAVSFLYNSKINANMASVSVRKDDYKVGLRAWLSSPLLGIGIQNYTGLKNFMESWRYFNTGFSNSVMDILSGGGLYLAAGYLFCFVKGIINSYRYNKNKLVFIILMFYLFVTTFFTYTDILLFCIVWFASKSQNKLEVQ